MYGGLRSALAALVVVMSAACASSSRRTEMGPRPVLAGFWAIDSSRSSELPELPDPSRAGGRQGGRPGGGMGPMPGGGPGGGMGGRGGRGAMGGGPGGERFDPEKMRRLFGTLAATRKQLRIDQTDGAIVLTYADGFALRVPTDGKERKVVGSALGETKVKSRWDEGRLIVEQSLEDGFKLRDEIASVAESERLVVETKISGPVPRAISFRTVYGRGENDR
jgi:hypothetical protein